MGRLRHTLLVTCTSYCTWQVGIVYDIQYTIRSLGMKKPGTPLQDAGLVWWRVLVPTLNVALANHHARAVESLPIDCTLWHTFH
jgi:hypothetical protein